MTTRPLSISVHAALGLAFLLLAPRPCLGSEAVPRPLVIVSLTNSTSLYRGSPEILSRIPTWFVDQATQAHRCINWSIASEVSGPGFRLVLDIVEDRTLRQIYLVFRLGQQESKIDGLRIPIFDNFENQTDAEELTKRAQEGIKSLLGDAQAVKLIVGQFQMTDHVAVYEEDKFIVVPVLQEEYRLKPDSELYLVTTQAICGRSKYKTGCEQGTLAVQAVGPVPQQVNARIKQLPCCPRDPWTENLKAKLERPGIVAAVILGLHDHCFDRLQRGCQLLRYGGGLSETP